MAEAVGSTLLNLCAVWSQEAGHLETVAEHMVFKDLLFVWGEALVTNRTIQRQGLNGLLLRDAIKHVASKV